ncbi:hypothetical protein COOONC_03398 [Cooperia oncophora]
MWRKKPKLYTLDSENVIAFLEDYDQERVLLLTKSWTEDSAEFERNFRKAMKSQRSDVIFAMLNSDVDEYSLVLDELQLEKEHLPALCYMGIGEDLQVCPLSDSSVGYIESVLRSLLESESEDESDESVETESSLLKDVVDSILNQENRETQDKKDN